MTAQALATGAFDSPLRPWFRRFENYSGTPAAAAATAIAIAHAHAHAHAHAVKLFPEAKQCFQFSAVYFPFQNNENTLPIISTPACRSCKRL